MDMKTNFIQKYLDKDDRKEKPSDIIFRHPHGAFDDAIASGALSKNQDDSNYAGNYMYMHTVKHESARMFGSNLNHHMDHFKNMVTRKYDVTNFYVVK